MNERKDDPDTGDTAARTRELVGLAGPAKDRVRALCRRAEVNREAANAAERERDRYGEERDREKTRADKAEAEAALWKAESQRGCWPKDAQKEIDCLRGAMAGLGLASTRQQEAVGELMKERDANAADAAKWRAAVAGVGDVEQYARALWGTKWESCDEQSRAEARDAARAVLALFRARVAAYDAGMNPRREGVMPNTVSEIHAALDFACSDVEVVKEGATSGTWHTEPEPPPPPPFVPVGVSALGGGHDIGSDEWCQVVHALLLDIARRVNAAGL